MGAHDMTSPNMSNSDVVVALTTTDSRDKAEALAEALVGEELVACVNIVGPIRSIYRWQGAVQRDEEFLCVMKTDRAHTEALKARLPALHSYSVPELVILPVSDGLPDYLAWVSASLRTG